MDELWTAKGRKGSYSSVIRDYMEKAKAHEVCESKVQLLTNNYEEKVKALKAELSRVKGLVKKLGSPELQGAVKETSKEPETKEG